MVKLDNTCDVLPPAHNEQPPPQKKNPSHKQENWSSENLSDLPKDTWLLSHKTRTKIQVSWGRTISTIISCLSLIFHFHYSLGLNQSGPFSILILILLSMPTPVNKDYSFHKPLTLLVQVLWWDPLSREVSHLIAQEQKQFSQDNAFAR